MWAVNIMLHPEPPYEPEQAGHPAHNHYGDQPHMPGAGPPQWGEGPPHLMHLRGMPPPSAPPMPGPHDRQYDVPARSPSPMEFHVMPAYYHDQAVNAPVPAV